MSFEERVKNSGAKVAILDIERMKGVAQVEFFDLSDFKNRRIHADDVTLWPRTICAAYQWFGKNPVHFVSEWGNGREEMLRHLWDVYDAAEVVVGHNIQGFDTKKLRSEWLLMGLTPPSPVKTIDTLKIARRELGMESNTLASLTARLGVDTKTDRYEVEVARAALAGDKTAQRRIKGYNVGDVHASRELWLALKGWNPSAPHLGPLDQETPRCPQCLSTNLQRNGTYLAVQIRYVQWRCMEPDCGGSLRSVQHSRAANVRAVR